MTAAKAFELRYRLSPFSPSAERVSPYLASDGELQILVAGTNLCERGEDKPWVRDNLFPYAAWFAESLPALTGEDPFPIPVEAKSGADFERAGLAAVRRLKSVERIEAASERYGGWVARHALRAGSDGGEPPNVFFRRVGDAVEVSWDNERLAAAGGGKFRHQAGLARVEAKAFERAVVEFIRGLVTELRGRHPALNEDPEILDVLSRLQ